MDEYEQFFYETRSEGLWNYDNGTMKEWRVNIEMAPIIQKWRVEYRNGAYNTEMARGI